MNDCWWNDTDIGKPKYLETQTKTCPSFPVSATRNGLGLNTELGGEMPATQRGLSHNGRPLYSKHNLNRNEREDLSDEVLLLQRLCLFGCNRQYSI